MRMSEVLEAVLHPGQVQQCDGPAGGVVSLFSSIEAQGFSSH